MFSDFFLTKKDPGILGPLSDHARRVHRYFGAAVQPLDCSERRSHAHWLVEKDLKNLANLEEECIENNKMMCNFPRNDLNRA